MAKTLVIAEANYAANALDVVTFDTTPCTGIELDKSAAEITAIGGTTTLTPTVTPANTTDEITWATSDDDVATVEDGVVTTKGVGTATITVTCGTQTATCEITSRAFMDTNVKKIVGKYISGTPVASGSNGLPALGDAARAGSLACSTGELHCYGTVGADVYPYVIPNNTKRIKLTVNSGSAISNIYTILWFNHETHVSGYNEVAEVFYAVASPTLSGGVYIGDVPEVEGHIIDAFTISLRVPSGSTLVEADLTNVTIEFLPESD